VRTYVSLCVALSLCTCVCVCVCVESKYFGPSIRFEDIKVALGDSFMHTKMRDEQNTHNHACYRHTSGTLTNSIKLVCVCVCERERERERDTTGLKSLD
jgi:hypothetical protein